MMRYMIAAALTTVLATAAVAEAGAGGSAPTAGGTWCYDCAPYLLDCIERSPSETSYQYCHVEQAPTGPACYLDSPCEGRLADLAPDGAIPEAQADASMEQGELTAEVGRASDDDIVDGAAYERGCQDMIVARMYTRDRANDLRDIVNTIEL